MTQIKIRLLTAYITDAIEITLNRFVFYEFFNCFVLSERTGSRCVILSGYSPGI